MGWEETITYKDFKRFKYEFGPKLSLKYQLPAQPCSSGEAITVRIQNPKRRTEGFIPTHDVAECCLVSRFFRRRNSICHPTDWTAEGDGKESCTDPLGSCPRGSEKKSKYQRAETPTLLRQPTGAKWCNQPTREGTCGTAGKRSAIQHILLWYRCHTVMPSCENKL